jgi:cytochrome c2
MKYSMTATVGASSLIAALLIYSVNVAGDLLVPAEKAALSTAAPRSKTAKTAPIVKTVKTAGAAGAAGVAKGAKVFNICKGCHTATKDGKNKYGPKLWGVVGRAKASVVGYKYSAALKGLGGKWSPADLNTFISSPKKFAPGTKMPFAGLKKATERAALIAFLRSRGGQPKP